MNELTIKREGNHYITAFTKLFLILLFAVCLALIGLIQLSTPFFPSSSQSMFVLLTCLIILLSVFTLNLSLINHVYCGFTLCFIALILIGIHQVIEPPKGDSSMLSSIWAQLFFISRPVALGLAITGCIGFIYQSVNKNSNLEAHCHLFSLLAGTTFLAGEIAGSYWAFIGWGKSWSWTGHFYVSALTYLLFILVFHLPKAWFNSPEKLAMGKASVLGVISAFMLGYKLI